MKPKILFLLLFLCSHEANAMSIFSKNVMFSEVVGTVTLNGAPVNNAEIERTYVWAWDDKVMTDKTMTNEKGLFKFPLREQGGGISSFLPHEPVISQKIIIKHDGQEYTAWRHTKHNYRENGELGGKKLKLNCELSSEYKDNGVYVGICTIAD